MGFWYLNLAKESQVQPLLVVFEDPHGIDGETQALLDSLVESLGSARLLLLVNYRPEYEHRWGSKTTYCQLRLDSLPAESAAELLAALLGPGPGLVPLTRWRAASSPRASSRAAVSPIYLPQPAPICVKTFSQIDIPCARPYKGDKTRSLEEERR